MTQNGKSPQFKAWGLYSIYRKFPKSSLSTVVMVKSSTVYFPNNEKIELQLKKSRLKTFVVIQLDTHNPLAFDGLKKVIQVLNEGKIPVIIGNTEAANSWAKKAAYLKNNWVSSDWLAIIATSGTSGEPKWVPISWNQVESSVINSPVGLLPKTAQAWLLSLPIHHTGGLAVLLRSAINGNNIVVANGLAKQDLISSFSTFPFIQTVSLVPKQLDDLIYLDELNLGLLQKKTILLGGGPVSSELRKKIHALKLDVFYSYGMSETFGQLFSISAKRLHESEVEQNIAGVISNGNAYKLDENDQLWVRGPQLFDGYIEEAENRTTELDKTQNWFNTGDIARVNDFGNLEILMRRTDLIVSGGKNIRPLDIENRIFEITAIPIHTFAIVGVEDKEWGEIIGLCIESKALKEFLKRHQYDASTQNEEGQYAVQALLNTLKNHLTSSQIPRKIQLIPELPKTDLGKIKRAEVKVFMNTKTPTL